MTDGTPKRKPVPPPSRNPRAECARLRHLLSQLAVWTLDEHNAARFLRLVNEGGGDDV